MGLTKKKLIANSFFVAKFNYWTIKWMLHRCSNSNRIERCLHERYFENTAKTSFREGLPEKDGSFSIHHESIQRFHCRNV